MLFDFHQEELAAVLGGRSSIDLPRLQIKNFDEASQFIAGYGFELANPQHLKSLWDFHRRSIVLLKEKFGFDDEDIPQLIQDPSELKDLRQLLLWASGGDKTLRRWSCAVLRCMHVYVHTEHDLFSFYSDEIQRQILVPLQEAIIHEGSGRSYLGVRGSDPKYWIELLQFQTKPFKTSNSTVVKLLAKSDALALTVMDKIGVRFETKTLFDSFRVVRFLVQQNLVSFPHVIPDQSRNNLYPFALFKLVCDQVRLRESPGQPLPDEELEKQLLSAFERDRDNHQISNPNLFSGQDYKAIKFIARKLIRTKQQGLVFFYPYEIQVMDHQSYKSLLSGPSEHSAYKSRQLAAAKARLFQEPTE